MSKLGKSWELTAVSHLDLPPILASTLRPTPVETKPQETVDEDEMRFPLPGSLAWDVEVTGCHAFVSRMEVWFDVLWRLRK